ncbi:hypothetical protein E2C01_006126 [Portunus trituberculatus]|uniref:Uncharacterized protein n=1 Tax=Portunus trituberculatus TaxID=210409 RepID=A0A5B7D0Y7_PORTR|nr:hypothetical protein [Portunus trituberculatus]
MSKVTSNYKHCTKFGMAVGWLVPALMTAYKIVRRLINTCTWPPLPTTSFQGPSPPQPRVSRARVLSTAIHETASPKLMKFLGLIWVFLTPNNTHLEKILHGAFSVLYFFQVPVCEQRLRFKRCYGPSGIACRSALLRQHPNPRPSCKRKGDHGRNTAGMGERVGVRRGVRQVTRAVLAYSRLGMKVVVQDGW